MGIFVNFDAFTCETKSIFVSLILWNEGNMLNITESKKVE